MSKPIVVELVNPGTAIHCFKELNERVIMLKNIIPNAIQHIKENKSPQKGYSDRLAQILQENLDRLNQLYL